LFVSKDAANANANEIGVTNEIGLIIAAALRGEIDKALRA